MPHTFVNTMFYFLLTQVLVFFSFESHIVWTIDDNIFQNLLQNFEKNDYSSLLNTFCRPSCLRDRLAWFTRIISPDHPGNMIEWMNEQLYLLKEGKNTWQQYNWKTCCPHIQYIQNYWFYFKTSKSYLDYYI